LWRMTSKVFLGAYPIQWGQTVSMQYYKSVIQYHLHCAVIVRCLEMVENVILHDNSIVHLADTVLKLGVGSFTAPSQFS
jgi:hypothetical protein